jgi:ABC-2 type transport system permease protein
MTEPRPMYWAVRREIWENRSLYLAPLGMAAFAMFGFMVSTVGMPQRRRAVLLLEPAKQRAAIGESYDVVAMMLIVTAFVVGFFYCLDALYGERRDRSVLFWKSLPVSDLTTVLSKVTIPMAVLPAVIFVTTVITQFLMMVWSTVVLLQSGLAGTTWTRINLLEQSLILLYGLVVVTLWHAPIYGWLLLVSAWARRATFLWAIAPFAAIGAVEHVAFNSRLFLSLLQHRVTGFMAIAFDVRRGVIDSLDQITALNFLTTPGLWLGLICAAAFVAVAVQLRRGRDPI